MLPILAVRHARAQVCPADWQPGGKSIKTSADGSLEYFGAEDKAEADDFGTLLRPVHAPQEFFSLIADKKPIVADFYAPWCDLPWGVPCLHAGPPVHWICCKHSCAPDWPLPPSAGMVDR